MTVLLIGSVLLGALLGRFFKVLVLVPASAAVLIALLIQSASAWHGLLHLFLEFAVLVISLQIGYVAGLFSHLIIRGEKRRGKLHPRPSTRSVATRRQ